MLMVGDLLTYLRSVGPDRCPAAHRIRHHRHQHRQHYPHQHHLRPLRGGTGAAGDAHGRSASDQWMEGHQHQQQDGERGDAADTIHNTTQSTTQPCQHRVLVLTEGQRRHAITCGCWAFGRLAAGGCAWPSPLALLGSSRSRGKPARFTTPTPTPSHTYTHDPGNDDVLRQAGCGAFNDYLYSWMTMLQLVAHPPPLP